MNKPATDLAVSLHVGKRVVQAHRAGSEPREHQRSSDTTGSRGMSTYSQVRAIGEVSATNTTGSSPCEWA
jgi:hypothetical protein